MIVDTRVIEMECRECLKTFTNHQDYFKHRSENCRPKTCPTCQARFTSAAELYRHINHQRKVSCDHCKKVFCSNDVYQKHIRSLRDITDDSIPDLNQRIYPETGYEDEEKYQEVVENKLNEIQDRKKKREHYQVINKQIDPSFTYREINDFLLDFYVNHNNAFKVNLGLGYILYHTINDTYQYFYVSTNNLLFDKAVPIVTTKDISELMKHIVSLDLATNFYLKKPSSGWVLAGLTNIEYIITELKNVPIGNPNELPAYIKNSKSIRSLTHNRNNEKYKDNNCFFRCLALHQGAKINALEKPTKKIKKELEDHIGENFDEGVTIDHIPTIEIRYQIAINIMSLKEDGSADIVYLSRLDYRPLYLNLYENHFSYISNYNTYAKRFQCYGCDRTFNRAYNLNRHAKVCCTEVEELYIGGKFKTNDTIFERLDKVGIKIQEQDRYYKFVSTYDYEAIQTPDDETVHGRKMHYVHVPATFSVCSNIPGHTEPKHQASDGSPQKLVDTMVEIQLQHQKTASLIMQQKFHWVFDKLEEMLQSFEEKEEETRSDDEKAKIKELNTLQCDFMNYCDKLPVIGFNSQRYDLPLIKRYLPSSLARLDSLPDFVIRKNNSYMTLRSKSLQ